MNMFITKKSFLILIMAHFSLCFPLESCYVDNQACEPDGHNLLTTVSNVTNKEDCRDICTNTTNCNYFSYYGSHSFPENQLCLTFSNCSKLGSCHDCFSEEEFCNKTCGDNIEGILGENIVEIVANVSADICKIECKKNDKCNFYTYYEELDTKHPLTCYLLSSLEEPFSPCEYCTTDTMNCYSGGLCGFLVDGNSTLVKAKIFNSDFTNSSIRIIAVGLCKESFLGIGGGGESNGRGVGGSGGGGSGDFFQISHTPVKFKKIFISVGTSRKPSTITTSDGEMVLRAKSGSKNFGVYGGNGYSGGGGAEANGGTNGGDGGSYLGPGGKGNGKDISKIELQNFTVTPGAGGNSGYIYFKDGYNQLDFRPQVPCGGGGGGVLVNEMGPDPARIEENGKGYGGGGACEYVASPGAIIIEVN